MILFALLMNVMMSLPPTFCIWYHDSPLHLPLFTKIPQQNTLLTKHSVPLQKIAKTARAPFPWQLLQPPLHRLHCTEKGVTPYIKYLINIACMGATAHTYSVFDLQITSLKHWREILQEFYSNQHIKTIQLEYDQGVTYLNILFVTNRQFNI